MNRYKICVYAISKNEEKFVDRWMDAVTEADMVIVVDTGSTDNTIQKLRDRGAIVYEESIVPWRFDHARNAALNHIPEDVDICVPNDLDEIFQPGWREKLESVWEPQYTRARYLFTWSYHPDGTPDKQYPMEKIHRRKEFKWVHPVHEVLEYSGTDPDQTVWIEGLVLNHYPDPAKPRSQYLPLLELSAKENPEDDRVMFWLGREYVYYGKYDLGIETLKRYLKLPAAKWKEERSASMRYLSRCYEAKGEKEEAKIWLFRAIAECPDVREPYFYMVQLGYRQKEWPLVYAMVEKGLAITQRSGSYLVQPECWGEQLYDYGAISAFHMELYDKALDYERKACEISPDNERLKTNLKFISQKIAELSAEEVH